MINVLIPSSPVTGKPVLVAEAHDIGWSSKLKPAGFTWNAHYFVAMTEEMDHTGKITAATYQAANGTLFLVFND